MGLGPPTCDDCHVWLTLHPPFVKEQSWRCPVCEKKSPNGYTHLRHDAPNVHGYDEVPFLRFMKGKSPNP